MKLSFSIGGIFIGLIIYLLIFVKFVWGLIAVLGLVVLGFFVIPTIIYLSEAKKYNNGVCPLCGGDIEHFDTDSQGGRGYCCKKCRKYYIWASWFRPPEKRTYIWKLK